MEFDGKQKCELIISQFLHASTRNARWCLISQFELIPQSHLTLWDECWTCRINTLIDISRLNSLCLFHHLTTCNRFNLEAIIQYRVKIESAENTPFFPKNARSRPLATIRSKLIQGTLSLRKLGYCRAIEHGKAAITTKNWKSCQLQIQNFSSRGPVTL